MTNHEFDADKLYEVFRSYKPGGAVPAHPQYVPATPDTMRLARAKSVDRALEVISDHDLGHILTTTETCGDQTWEHVETGAIIDLAAWIHDGTHPDALALDSEHERTLSGPSQGYRNWASGSANTEDGERS